MTALAGRRRRNTLLALAAGLLAAVLAPAMLYVGAKAITNSTAGKNALADALPEQTFPATPTAMLATVDAAGELTSVTVFVLAPDADISAAGYDQRGGSMISVPINVDSVFGRPTAVDARCLRPRWRGRAARRSRIGDQPHRRLQQGHDRRRVHGVPHRFARAAGRLAPRRSRFRRDGAVPQGSDGAPPRRRPPRSSHRTRRPRARRCANPTSTRCGAASPRP